MAKKSVKENIIALRMCSSGRNTIVNCEECSYAEFIDGLDNQEFGCTDFVMKNALEHM